MNVVLQLNWLQSQLSLGVWSRGNEKDIRTGSSVGYKSLLQRAREATWSRKRRVLVMHAWFRELFDADTSW